MGVERSGNLWAWEKRSGSVTVLSPAGRELSPWKAPGAVAVDLDSEWGLAGLFHLGTEIHWQSHEPVKTVPLRGQYTDICWIDAATVAITPQRNEHRVEIWNLRDAALVRAIGREPPPPAGRRAVRLRAVLLRFDPIRRWLYTLESETGNLQVYDLEGRLLWHAELGDPDRAEVETWLKGLDASQRPLLFRLYPALDGQGTLWAVDRMSSASKTAELVGATAGGVRRLTLEGVSCPSRRLAFWGGHVVAYADSATSRTACNWTGRFP